MVFPPMARLHLVTPEGQQTVELRSVNSLGRHPNNTIQLLDKIVSKEHCIIEQRGEIFVLRDLGSLNGTYINADRVRGEGVLHHGDEITLGATRARFDDGSGRQPSSPQITAPQQAWQPAAPPPQQYSATGPSQARPAFGSEPTAVAPIPPLAAIIAGQPAAGPNEGYRPGNLGSSGIAPPKSAPIVSGSKNFKGTRIDIQDENRTIGTQIAATQRGFLPYEQIARDPIQVRADYERLRLSHELSREIALERDTNKLLEKILDSIFKFIRADRGVIFLIDGDGKMVIGASRRRDGTDEPIAVSATIMNHVMKERAAVLTSDASMDFAASKGKSMILNRISSAIVVPLVHNDEMLGVLWLDSETLAQFQRKDLELVTAVVNQAAMFIEINVLAKKVEQEIVTRERFSRLLSPNVAERVISGQLEIKKGGELVRECTVFNSDIRGFTRMSEGTEPQIVVDMLNEYFERMVETLFKYEGTLDKFMGDGILAFWGSPLAHPDDPVRCVQCALDQMQVLGLFNRERLSEGKAPLAMGIGIHTGPGVVGYVGSSKALSYTVIGDTANTSARLCASALAGQILVSEATLAQLGGRFEYEEVDARSLKGKERPMRRFNVLREKAGSVAKVG
jgi:adenylate cyclase